MKFISAVAFAFCAALLISAASAAPTGSADAQILRSASEVGPESFTYEFETSDGQAAQAQGQLKNVGSEYEAISVRGSYRFVGDDGVTYEVTYVADENGFQPSGAHLPVA